MLVDLAIDNDDDTRMSPIHSYTGECNTYTIHSAAISPTTRTMLPGVGWK